MCFGSCVLGDEEQTKEQTINYTVDINGVIIVSDDLRVYNLCHAPVLKGSTRNPW